MVATTVVAKSCTKKKNNGRVHGDERTLNAKRRCNLFEANYGFQLTVAII